jgi:hypothetical protein
LSILRGINLFDRKRWTGSAWESLPAAISMNPLLSENPGVYISRGSANLTCYIVAKCRIAAEVNHVFKKKGYNRTHWCPQFWANCYFGFTADPCVFPMNLHFFSLTNALTATRNCQKGFGENTLTKSPEWIGTRNRTPVLLYLFLHTCTRNYWHVDSAGGAWGGHSRNTHARGGWNVSISGSEISRLVCFCAWWVPFVAYLFAKYYFVCMPK